METEVLIVGGGLSGLSLADHLAQSGVDFILVEAQGRLGGRILTEELSGGNFDLGPAWFWHGQPRIAELVRRFALPVFDQYATGDLIYQDQSGAVQRGRGYASMQGSLRVGGGMGSLINALSDVIASDRVMLETRLRSLSRQNGSISATLERAGQAIDAQAKRVILAAPPRVIANTISFAPSLGVAKTEAMARIPTWMAGQAKILAVYDQPHWRNAGLSGDAMSQRGPMVEIHDASPIEGGPFALFGFVGVPPDVRETKKDEMMRLALAQLTAMFGAAMAEPIKIILQDWASVPEVATLQDRAPVRSHPNYGLPTDLRHLWGGALHLASTEAGKEFGGFLEGSLEAAEATARELTMPPP